MAERRSILANLAALVAGQAVALALGLVSHAILARALGPEDYGILGFAVAILSYFGVVAALGTDSWATREIAAAPERAREVAGTVVSLRLVLAASAFVGLVVLVIAWDRPLTVSTVVLIQGISLATAALTLDFAFQGIERMDAVARRQVVTAVIALAGVVAVAYLGAGVVAAAAVMQAAGLAAAFFMVGEWIAICGVPQFARQIVATWRDVLRRSAPLAVTGVIVTIYASIDIVMLGFLRPSDEVGFYVAAVRLLTIGLAVAAVLRTAFLPVLSRLQDPGEARVEAGRHFARAAVTAGGGAAALGFALAPEILAVIYGEDFAPATAVLRILMVNLIAASAVEVFHTQLVAWRLHRQQMRLILLGAAFNIGLNLYAIPRFGMEGAAGATLASTVLVLTVAAVLIRSGGYETHLTSHLRSGAFALCLSAVGYAAGQRFDAGGDLVRIVCGGVALISVYALVIHLTGSFQWRETLRYLSRRA